MNDQHDDTEDGERPIDPSTLAENEFADFGNGRIAYIRPVSFKGEEAFAVHSADGLTLAVITDRDVALAVARHNALEPLSLH